MKKKKKHWTTKNTHFQRKKKKMKEENEEKIPLIVRIFIIIAILGMLFKYAINTDRSGYDHFIGIPKEWIKWVK